MKFRGTTFTPALPKSEKSFRKTVTFSEGSYAKSLPVEAERVLERAGDVGDEVRLARREVDEAQVVGLERRDWPRAGAAPKSRAAATRAAAERARDFCREEQGDEARTGRRRPGASRSCRSARV